MARILLGPSLQTTPPNFSSFVTRVLTLTIFGVAQQVTSQVVPDGIAVVFRNHINNGFTSRIYIAYSSSAILSAADRITLERGASTELKLSNTNLVWWDGSSSGVQLEILTEV